MLNVNQHKQIIALVIKFNKLNTIQVICVIRNHSSNELNLVIFASNSALALTLDLIDFAIYGLTTELIAH